MCRKNWNKSPKNSGHSRQAVVIRGSSLTQVWLVVHLLLLLLSNLFLVWPQKIFLNVVKIKKLHFSLKILFKLKVLTSIVPRSQNVKKLINNYFFLSTSSSFFLALRRKSLEKRLSLKCNPKIEYHFSSNRVHFRSCKNINVKFPYERKFLEK